MQPGVKLKDIAEISTGVTFRSRIEHIADGNVTVIQMKDLGADNLIHADNAICSHLNKVSESQLLRESDIVFRSRGSTHTAAFVDKNLANAVLSAPLFRIRSDMSRVSPGYLFWYLNQPAAQTYFATQARGSRVRMIGKADLAEMRIALPTLEQQKAIAEIITLSMQEHDVLKKIQTARKRYIQTIIAKIIETGENNV